MRYWTVSALAWKASLICILTVVLPVGASESPPEIGVLVLAHGGQQIWNQQVLAAVRQTQLPYPVEVVFGMGMEEGEVRALDEAIQRLETHQIRQLIVIPLLISSHSEIYRQLEFLLGLRRDSPFPDHPLTPLAPQASVRMRHAMDAHPYVREIVLERGRELSRDPAHETIILVAHGPLSHADDQRWLETLRRIAATVKEQGGFRAVEVATVRDDASDEIQAKATAQLRQIVEETSKTSRVLVVPVVISDGGIEQRIAQRLEGLSFAFSGRGLLPHPLISRWIAEQVEQVVDGSALQSTDRRSRRQ